MRFLMVGLVIENNKRLVSAQKKGPPVETGGLNDCLPYEKELK